MRAVQFVLQQMANIPEYRIPDITETEPRVLSATRKQRDGRNIAARPADAEARINSSDRELTPRPVIVRRSEDGFTFVIIKTGQRNDRCRFVYKPCKQIDTGTREYHDLAECTVALRQVRADHVAEEHGDLPAR